MSEILIDSDKKLKRSMTAEVTGPNVITLRVKSKGKECTAELLVFSQEKIKEIQNRQIEYYNEIDKKKAEEQKLSFKLKHFIKYFKGYVEKYWNTPELTSIKLTTRSERSRS